MTVETSIDSEIQRWILTDLSLYVPGKKHSTGIHFHVFPLCSEFLVRKRKSAKCGIFHHVAQSCVERLFGQQ